MSLETWMEEFYPVPASHEVGFSNREALEHALRKWQGLRRENVKKHGLTRRVNLITEDGIENFPVDASTCAVCFKFPCRTCPLTRVRGVACDAPEDRQSPYHAFVEEGDPEPMIKLITKAIEFVELRDEEAKAVEFVIQPNGEGEGK